MVLFNKAIIDSVWCESVVSLEFVKRVSPPAAQIHIHLFMLPV